MKTIKSHVDSIRMWIIGFRKMFKKLLRSIQKGQKQEEEEEVVFVLFR